MYLINFLDHLTYMNRILHTFTLFLYTSLKQLNHNQSQLLQLSLFNMIELKINGPKKRTVINSLKCEILKDKNRFFLMRFKSLPINKKQSRNCLWIDVPHTVKTSLENQQKHYFKSSTPKRQHFLNLSEVKGHKRLWTQQLQKSYLWAEYNYLSKSQFNTYDKDGDQFQKIRKKSKTIATQPQESEVECSLRNYIRRHLSLKQSSLKKDAEEAQKLSQKHAQQVDSMKKCRNFRSNQSTEKQKLQQTSINELLYGSLSPKICNIKKSQASRNDANNSRNSSVFQRAMLQEYQQSSNYFEYQGFVNKINSPSKSPVERSLKKIQFKNTGAFKYSIGPWRNSGFGCVRRDEP